MNRTIECQNFGFFNYSDNVEDKDKYRYTAEEFSTILHGLTGNGVVKRYGDMFDATNNNYTITVKSGMGWVGGHCAYNDEAVSFTFDSADDGKKQCVGLELDAENAVINMVVKISPDSTYPAATDTFLPLWYVRVDSTTNKIVVNDARNWQWGVNDTHIIYSATQPSYEQGALWICPV